MKATAMLYFLVNAETTKMHSFGRTAITLKIRQTGTYLASLLTHPGFVFVTLASFFGLLMVFVMPLFMAPDEGTHFLRAYEVSGGHLLSQTKGGLTGDYVPAQIDKIVTKDFSLNVRDGGTTPSPYSDYFSRKVPAQPQKFVDFRSSALYSPIGYVPQSIGVGIGRLVYPSVGVMVTLGRLCNLAVYVLLIYWAIHIARQGKWVYAAAGLFPVAVQQGASLSSDVMTIGLSFVFIAIVHNIFLERKKVSRRHLTYLMLLAVGLSLTKQTSIVLLLCLLSLPTVVFGSLRRKIVAVGIIGIAALIASVGWYALIKMRQYNLQISGAPGISQAAQEHFLEHHPLSYLHVLWHTYVYEGLHGTMSTDFLLTSAYGVFSWIAYKLPLLFITFGYISLLFALLYADGSEALISGKHVRHLRNLSWVQLAVFMCSLIAIATALYLTWTPVGASQAWGLQGRYFIPLLPLLIPFFIWLGQWIKFTVNKAYYMGLILSVVAVINLTSMVILTGLWFGQ